MLTKNSRLMGWKSYGDAPARITSLPGTRPSGHWRATGYVMRHRFSRQNTHSARHRLAIKSSRAPGVCKPLGGKRRGARGQTTACKLSTLSQRKTPWGPFQNTRPARATQTGRWSSWPQSWYALSTPVWGSLKDVQRAADTLPTFVHNVSVNHGRAHVFVT